MLTLEVPVTVLVFVASNTEVPFHTWRVMFPNPELSEALHEKFCVVFTALELPFNGASRLTAGFRATENKTVETFSFPTVSFAYTLRICPDSDALKLEFAQLVRETFEAESSEYQQFVRLKFSETEKLSEKPELFEV